jgi:hypothetical protein
MARISTENRNRGLGGVKKLMGGNNLQLRSADKELVVGCNFDMETATGGDIRDRDRYSVDPKAS